MNLASNKMANDNAFEKENELFELLRHEIAKVIVGQQDVVNKLLIGMLCRGHILIEGIPGLGKTMTISTLAKCISAQFNRIQFTPDLLPADLIGTLIFNQKTSGFETRKGPIFSRQRYSSIRAYALTSPTDRRVHGFFPGILALWL